MRHHGGKAMEWGEAGALDFAERFKPLGGCFHEVAYIVADQICPRGERWKPRDGARVRAVHKIAEHLGCSLSTANNAMQAAELGRCLDVDKVGTPNVQQLMAIVWTHVKARG
jgi:hypothetical protein